jgi:penicillin-binding protein 2
MNDGRRYFIQGFFILVGIIFIIRLFFLQVLDKNYRSQAESNVLQRVDEFPYRGLFYDRYGELLVINNPVFDLMVIPRKAVVRDTLGLCNLLNISKDDFLAKMKDARDYSSVKPSVFLKQLPIDEFAKIQDYLVDFPGFYINARSVRSYPHSVLAHALGYIGEIDKPKLERDTTKYYKRGDYIGISGMEAAYEPSLRGRRGVKYRLVNVRGVEKGSFKDGEFDTLPIPGQNVISTIDLELQEYIEKLMEGKSGSVVAIEPSTGEILTLVSSPSYDPNLLTGRDFGKNFMALQTAPEKPLFNRPIMADVYPPGSTFKMFQALVAMQEGIITADTRIPCNRGIIACHGSHSYEDLQGAIKYSCNPYFHQVFRRIVNQDKSSNTFKDTEIGLENWKRHMSSFGLGRTLGIDLPNEKPGRIPGASLYNRIYGEGRWKFSTIYSLSIGQGEIGVSPLQMANLAAILANRGHYFTPHLVKYIGDERVVPEEYKIRHQTTVDPQHFEPIINAMWSVVNTDGGTGFRARIKDLDVCGKTGTSQNPQGEDHSVFLAFAPKDNPKIAVSVYVENSGQGARAAASIAGLVIEKYLNREIARKNIEDYVMAGRFVY